MKYLKSGLLVPIALFCLASAAPAFAQNGNGNGNGRPVPGPLAGAGLPFLVAVGAAGAYKLMRRRHDNRQQHGGTERR